MSAASNASTSSGDSSADPTGAGANRDSASQAESLSSQADSRSGQAESGAHADNFSQAELDKFGALANRWWDPQGPQKPLHALNPVRLDYVAQRVSLRAAQVLDVGCGGGLLSEALASAGAQVTAIDLAPELIKVAKLHRLETGVSVDYRLQSVESLAQERPDSFDAITCMEMLEHVPDPAAIVRACARLLKPGGRLFVSTLNRTPAAFALAIVGAEYVARLVPRGTHQYRDFIKPSELAGWLRDSGLQLEDVSGLMYEPWRNTARITSRTEINYLVCALKADPAQPGASA